MRFHWWDRGCSVVNESLPLISDSNVNSVMSSLHMHIFKLKRQDLCKLFCNFVAQIVLSDVLLRVKVRKLYMLLPSHKHGPDNHLHPCTSSIPGLAAKSSLYKILIVKDTVPDKLFIIVRYRSNTHFFSPHLLL